MLRLVESKPAPVELDPEFLALLEEDWLRKRYWEGAYEELPEVRITVGPDDDAWYIYDGYVKRLFINWGDEFYGLQRKEPVSKEPEPKLRLASSQSAARAAPRAKYKLPVASLVPA
jgi:hypothetical protein